MDSCVQNSIYLACDSWIAPADEITLIMKETARENKRAGKNNKSAGNSAEAEQTRKTREEQRRQALVTEFMDNEEKEGMYNHVMNSIFTAGTCGDMRDM